jgi:hypothetical protein
METGAPAAGAESQHAVQLREEELQARKTSDETGQVTLGKGIVQERNRRVDSHGFSSHDFYPPANARAALYAHRGA